MCVCVCVSEALLLSNLPNIARLVNCEIRIKGQDFCSIQSSKATAIKSGGKNFFSDLASYYM